MLATDESAEAVALAARNAERNGASIDTAVLDWTRPGDLVRLAPFDFVLAADVLYEQESVEPMLSLLPRLAPEVWLADPGRLPARTFIERAGGRWTVETSVRDVVRIHRLRQT